MNVCLKAAVPEDKETLGNLLEKYLYEFSEWEDQDVDGNENTGRAEWGGRRRFSCSAVSRASGS